MMVDEVCRVDQEISLLMQEPGDGSTHPSNENKFWSDSFDGLKFFYDHLDATGDVNKVKSFRRQKITQHLSTYLMQYFVLARGLFESWDDLEDRCVNLQKDVDRLTGSEKYYADKVSALEKSLASEVSKTKNLTKSCEDLRDYQSKLSKELDMVKKSCADLQQSLERSCMDALNVRDVAFDWVKDQVMCLYPTLDISSMDFIKSIVDGKLVDVEDVDGSPVTDGPDGNGSSLAEVTK